jgi:hypothetical protein
MSRKIITKGFTALAFVLVVSAVLVVVCIGSVSYALSVQDVSVASLDYDRARLSSYACLEYALGELTRTLSYEGNEGILLSTGSCDLRVIREEDDRVIQIEARSGASVYYADAVVDSLSPVTHIRSLRRVSDFE